MSEANPIVKMLSWKTRLLETHEIEAILASLASLPNNPFTLTELSQLLPPNIAADKNKRRSVSTLLTNLQEIGYLYRPSARKWMKKAATLSHFLSPLLIELNQLEKTPLKVQAREKRVLNIGGA
jgi:hypothetical protein